MKKVLCNVLFGVNMTACRCDMENVLIDLGLFEEREDAECAGILVKQILSGEDDFEFLSVGNYEVKKEYFPDAEMNKSVVTSRFNEDLDAFVRNNPYVQQYIETNGFGNFSMLLIDCLNQCMDAEESSKKSNQKGE